MALTNLVWNLLKWQVWLCRVRHPRVCPSSLSSCLPLTEVATEPVCVAGVSDEPPTQAWGSPPPVWFLWQRPTRQSSSYLQGCGVTASFMRWHCLVLVDLTFLSPPSVFQGIWPWPRREEAGTCRVASCCLPCSRSQDHLPSLPSTRVAEAQGPSVLSLPLWGFKLPKIRTRLSARLSAQINIYYLQGGVSAALADPTGEIF